MRGIVVVVFAWQVGCSFAAGTALETPCTASYATPVVDGAIAGLMGILTAYFASGGGCEQGAEHIGCSLGELALGIGTGIAAIGYSVSAIYGVSKVGETRNGGRRCVEPPDPLAGTDGHRCRDNVEPAHSVEQEAPDPIAPCNAGLSCISGHCGKPIPNACRPVPGAPSLLACDVGHHCVDGICVPQTAR